MLAIAVFLLIQAVGTRAEAQNAFFKTEENYVLFDESPIF